MFMVFAFDILHRFFLILAGERGEAVNLSVSET